MKDGDKKLKDLKKKKLKKKEVKKKDLSADDNDDDCSAVKCLKPTGLCLVHELRSDLFFIFHA